MATSHTMKYLAFPVIAPVCGFAAMWLIAPATTAAHDGGFLGMALGLLVGQVIFSFLLLDRWRILCAMAVWLAASLLTWTLVGILAELWGDPYGADLTGIGFLFFLVYTGVSVASWEVAYRWTSGRR